MRLNEHEKQGYAVWMDGEELDTLIDAADQHSTVRRIALGLMGECGLRREEAARIRPRDVVETGGQKYIRVWDGKGGKLRETPAPQGLCASIRAFADVSDRHDGPNDDTALAGVSDRTLGRWVDAAAELAAEEIPEDSWQHVTPHDLRRSWAQRMLEADVPPHLLMEFGGWDSYETFRDAYLGAYSQKRINEALGEVDWL